VSDKEGSGLFAECGKAFDYMYEGSCQRIRLHKSAGHPKTEAELETASGRVLRKALSMALAEGAASTTCLKANSTSSLPRAGRKTEEGRRLWKTFSIACCQVEGTLGFVPLLGMTTSMKRKRMGMKIFEALFGNFGGA